MKGMGVIVKVGLVSMTLSIVFFGISFFAFAVPTEGSRVVKWAALVFGAASNTELGERIEVDDTKAVGWRNTDIIEISSRQADITVGVTSEDSIETSYKGHIFWREDVQPKGPLTQVGISGSLNKMLVHVEAGETAAIADYSSKTKLVVRVPTLFKGVVRVETSSGDVKVEPNFTADLESKSSSGDVRLESLSGAVDIETSSGDIAAVLKGAGEECALQIELGRRCPSVGRGPRRPGCHSDILWRY